MFRSYKKVLALVVGGLVAASFFSCGGGGVKREITVISREEGSGTRGAFDELMNIVKDGTNLLFSDAVIVSSTDEAASKVEVDRNAIGYTSLGSVNANVKALSIDGVVASEANIKNGSYGISRPFLLAALKTNEDPIVLDFLRFSKSDIGQEIVQGRGLVTVGVQDTYTSPGNLSGRLTISGSTSLERVVQRLSEDYQRLNPNVRVEVNYNGSSAGINDCRTGRSQIAMSSRPLKADEEELLTNYTFAHDGIAVVVNPENPINDLPAETVTKIFKGEIRSWDDVQ